MKDLYRRLALEAYCSDRDKIKKALFNCSDADRKDAEAVLLHHERKTSYDRIHRTLTLIGAIRSSLNLNNTEYWSTLDYGDFYQQFDGAGNYHTNRHETYKRSFLASSINLLNTLLNKLFKGIGYAIAFVWNITIIGFFLYFIVYIGIGILKDDNNVNAVKEPVSNAQYKHTSQPDYVQQNKPGSETIDDIDAFLDAPSDYTQQNKPGSEKLIEPRVFDPSTAQPLDDNKSRAEDFIESESKSPNKALYYVNIHSLNLREGPTTSSDVITVLKQYDTLEKIQENEAQSDWIYVKTINGDVGYVSQKYITLGDGRIAEMQWCIDNAGERPYTAEVFVQKSRGEHEINIHNGTSQDALVKLKNKSGSTVLSFYVRAKDKAKILNVPEGYFGTQFATGNDFSRVCQKFMHNMNAFTYPDYDPFITTSDANYYYNTIVEYTLHAVPSGNVQPGSIDLSQFLDD
jgi:uncharacterized protein YgiM (DUF1202 family)